MDQRGKKKFQPWANLANVYGDSILDAPGPGRTYESAFGLYLNLNREETRRAFGMVGAIRDALAPGALDKRYFAAVCEDAEEAQAMHNLHVNRVRAAEAGF